MTADAFHRHDTPHRHTHVHGTSDPSLACTTCRSESTAAYKASVTAWHKREQARFVRAHRADASLLRTAAGWVFGALLLTSPFWLLWSLASRDSGGSLLPFLAATIVSFLLTEDWWPEPAEREPVMDEFARSVWGLEWDAMVTARSREPNWQAGLARREQARAQRDEARARAMREVADRAVANRPADELPFL